tara:strand:+ start:4278 stop:4526 length:249 start_codon:yes stop_codon:yes gene_type:complete
MKIKILTFASIRNYSKDFLIEIDDTDNISLEILKEKILKKEPSLKEIIDSIAFAVNQEYCTDEKFQINDQDEIALIPPVSGG